MGRILIADSNSDRANHLRTVLTTYLGAFEFVIVTDGRQPLDIWPSGFIGLVAACKSPCMTGIDLIREIHAKGGKKLLVLYSNRDGVEAMAYNAGFREPFDVSSISDEVSRHRLF